MVKFFHSTKCLKHISHSIFVESRCPVAHSLPTHLAANWMYRAVGSGPRDLDGTFPSHPRLTVRARGHGTAPRYHRVQYGSDGLCRAARQRAGETRMRVAATRGESSAQDVPNTARLTHAGTFARRLWHARSAQDSLQKSAVGSASRSERADGHFPARGPFWNSRSLDSSPVRPQ